MDYDDCVVPAHSFKFAAALQAAHVGDTPILIRTEMKAGHGAGDPTSKVIEEVSKMGVFVENISNVNVRVICLGNLYLEIEGNSQKPNYD